MSDAAQPPEEAPAGGGKGKGKSVRLWLLGLLLALPAAAGGYYLTFAEPWRGDSAESAAPAAQAPATSDYAYVAIEPIVINLGARGHARMLRFSAQLEVAPGHTAEVGRLMPRIVDVLNIYLRALEMHEIEEPAALIRLRAQMLRRVQIVTGAGRVNDLLVTEFILN